MNASAVRSGNAYRIQVGNSEFILFKLDAILEEFYLEGWSPGDDGLEDALLEALREEGDRIPRGYEPACKAALSKAFSHHCEINAVTV